MESKLTIQTSVKEILVIEDNAWDFSLLREYLDLAGVYADRLYNLDSIQAIRERQPALDPDLIFLDLNIADSQGLATFLSVNAIYPSVPIIILSGLQNTETSIQAIQAGAQDYLLKDKLDETLLYKAIQYSIERKRILLNAEESNKRYELVSKATNDPIWDWCRNSNEVSWNDKVEIFGYPRHLRKNISWWIQNLHPDDARRVRIKLQRQMKGDHPVWQDHYRFRCANGAYKHVINRGYILRDHNNQVHRMIGIMQDITEQVLLQQRLDLERRHQQQEILRATIDGQEKERNEIGRELHDNINQMLASVKLLVATYASQHDKEDSTLKKVLNVTEDCIQEIRRLSGNLVTLHSKKLNLKEAVEELIATIAPLTGIEFDCSCDPELMAQLNDQEQLNIYRIVQEQVNNILKYAEATEVKMNMSRHGEGFRLIITDNGKGFNPRQKHVGIGLGNIRTRVELSGGQFDIQSEPGKGCKLSITIPITNIE